MTRGVLDTSLVIALAHGEDVEYPDSSAISAVTLCELHTGVLRARDEQRAGRLATLAIAERRFRPLVVDERVAPHYARIVTDARRSGRRPGTADALIAATAAAHALPVYTRDHDFVGFSGVEVVLV